MQTLEDISLMFWNLTNVTTINIDSKDFIWSMIMIFGKFSGGAVDLPFLNTTMECKRGDIYFINSNKTFHNVCTSSPEQQVFVFTNHRAVVNRFVDL